MIINTNDNQHFYYWSRVKDEIDQEEGKLTAEWLWHWEKKQKNHVKLKQAYKDLMFENRNKGI